MSGWAVALVIAVVLLVALGMEDGSVPRAGAVLAQLAERPDVTREFRDPEHGRFDATVFLFTSVLLAPFVVLGLLCTGVLAHIVLEATVLPVGRQLGFPDRFVTAGVAFAGAATAYVHTDLWLPTTVKFLALLARAWVVSAT